MAYSEFDKTLPDSTLSAGTDVPDETRMNLLALRDAIADNMVGWDAEAQKSDGTAPPTDPEQPEQWVYSKGTERIKVSLTWGTSGGATDQVTEEVWRYSSNSGSTYDLMADAVDAPLAKRTFTYDSNGNLLSWAWS